MGYISSDDPKVVYNYEAFTGRTEHELNTWKDTPELGSGVLDFQLWCLDSKELVHLSTLLFSHVLTIVEFGSITNPYSRFQARKMDAQAEEYQARGIGSFFVYTNEAHPGENYPHHQSLSQKFKHAGDMQSTCGLSRSVLVDGIEGKCHKQYGGLRSMVWIFDNVGRPVYKAKRTNSESVHNSVVLLLENRERKRSENYFECLQVERLEFFSSEESMQFLTGLEFAGKKAVKDYYHFMGKDC